MKMAGLSRVTGAPETKFTYNGKELEDDFNLNWYHYGARYYDPQLGRWLQVDPADEFHSPYVYVGNNPVNNVDPDGQKNEHAENIAEVLMNYAPLYSSKYSRLAEGNLTGEDISLISEAYFDLSVYFNCQIKVDPHGLARGFGITPQEANRVAEVLRNPEGTTAAYLAKHGFLNLVGYYAAASVGFTFQAIQKTWCIALGRTVDVGKEYVFPNMENVWADMVRTELNTRFRDSLNDDEE